MKQLSLLSVILLLIASFLVMNAHSSFVSAAAVRGNDNYIRNVTGGLIQGYQSEMQPGVGVWKNVPFGTAPRFQNPVPRQPWPGILNCTRWGPGCSQLCDFPQPALTCSATTSEDCLNLNIYSPDPQGSQGGLPVLFWIPGGRWQFGSGGCPLYDSSYLAQSQGIVVVTINYRLGALGALVTKNGIRGNFNMKDQLLALQWVRANIANFGGNPNDITIGGESAGAMSVGCAMISPPFANLFHGAIMSSNPFGIPYQSMQLALDLADNFLKHVGCSGQPDLNSELACLNAIDINVLVNASNNDKIFPWPSRGLTPDIVPWGPVVGDVDGFLPMQPIAAAEQGKLVTPVPMLVGSNANDSLLFVADLSSSPMNGIEEVAVLTALFGLEDMIKIEELYPKSQYSDKRIFLSKVMTQYLFSCANRYFIAQSQKNQGVTAYFYLFNHYASFTDWLWGGYCDICENFITHASDLPFEFALNNSPYANQVPSFTTADQLSSQMMVNMWGSFVRSKSPNMTNIGWQPLSSSNYNRFNAQPSNPVVMKDFEKKFCDYYDSIGYNHRGY